MCYSREASQGKGERHGEQKLPLRCDPTAMFPDSTVPFRFGSRFLAQQRRTTLTPQKQIGSTLYAILRVIPRT